MDASNTFLKKVVTHEAPDLQPLPETLAAPNLMRLQSPALWLPGKRVHSDLHRLARMQNFTYMASVPIGSESAITGLLVVGDHLQPPPEKVMSLVRILGSQISAALDHSILVENLQRAIEVYNQSLVIHTVISENNSQGIILLKPDLSILELNPTAEDLLGYACHEVVGQNVENILIGAETLSSALKAALEGIETPNLGTINLHRRTGQSFLAHVQTIPVHSGSDLLGIVIMLADVSENEQIRIRTQQLEQRALLGNITAIFAHEVRNPINNISTGLQLMDLNLPEGDPNHELIARLQHDCSRLTHLMESVLSFSRPQEYKLAPTDLGELLKRLLDRWGPRLTRVNVTSYFYNTPGCPKVNGDPHALEQVFTNLISNAVQAMSEKGGTLSVRVALMENGLEQPHVQVTVSDTGPGIPEDIRARIFEPFVTTNPKGTGLGLAITKSIVTAHKGKIQVNSFPGGTLFEVYLPVMEGEAV